MKERIVNGDDEGRERPEAPEHEVEPKVPLLYVNDIGP
jgi:hypothetical protein